MSELRGDIVGQGSEKSHNGGDFLSAFIRQILE
jgi:hypothetical protein